MMSVFQQRSFILFRLQTGLTLRGLGIFFSVVVEEQQYILSLGEST
jgi:hypothetical protein